MDTQTTNKKKRNQKKNNPWQHLAQCDKDALLALAAFNGNAEFIKELQRAGAKDTQIEFPLDTDFWIDSACPIFFALLSGNKESISALLPKKGPVCLFTDAKGASLEDTGINYAVAYILLSKVPSKITQAINHDSKPTESQTVDRYSTVSSAKIATGCIIALIPVIITALYFSGSF